LTPPEIPPVAVLIIGLLNLGLGLYLLLRAVRTDRRPAYSLALAIGGAFFGGIGFVNIVIAITELVG
jgi:hypothetical protein